MKAKRYSCATHRCPLQWKKVTGKKCRSCGAETDEVRALQSGAGGFYVRADFPEHWNVSLGCVVKNRKHHEQIQKERGLMDWQPVKESPMLARLRKEGHSI